MKGNVVKYARDNIDTDVIIPGQYLKVHDYAELATHAMEGLDPDFHSKIKEGDFILSGKNFGCGSSRDWAAKGTYLLGVEAVIATSFERRSMRSIRVCIMGGFGSGHHGLLSDSPSI